MDDRDVLSECWLSYLLTEPQYSTVGFDVINDREELLDIFRSYNFEPDSPQLALWDIEKEMVISGYIDYYQI